jgi:hypothetical protein
MAKVCGRALYGLAKTKSVVAIVVLSAGNQVITGRVKVRGKETLAGRAAIHSAGIVVDAGFGGAKTSAVNAGVRLCTQVVVITTTCCNC